MLGVVKGKRWLLLTRWMNLDSQKRQQLNQLFALNRRVMKASRFPSRLNTWAVSVAIPRFPVIIFQGVHRMDNYSVHRMDSYSELVNVQCQTRIGFPPG